MPDLVLEIAADTGLGEPMWCFNAWGRAPAEFPAERLQPIEHPAGVRAITGIGLFCPSLRDDCVTQRMANAGHLTLEPAADHWIELEFDGGAQGLCTDFRPACRWSSGNKGILVDGHAAGSQCDKCGVETTWL